MSPRETAQRCVDCGKQWFGSDAIDGYCDDCRIKHHPADCECFYCKAHRQLNDPAFLDAVDKLLEKSPYRGMFRKYTGRS